MQSGSELGWYIQRFVILLVPYAVAATGITLISVTPLGRAVISWLKGHINRGRAAELAAALEQVRFELGEVQERLDFTERQLMSGTTAAPPQLHHPQPQPRSSQRVQTPV